MKYLATILTSLYNCERHLDEFFNSITIVEQFDKFEILLLHNAPTEKEKNIITQRIEDYPNIKHIIIPHREGLYTTWNRGIKLASAEYITNWNVDDKRYPDSLIRQLEILENKNVDIVCGDVLIVSEIDQSLKQSTTPDIDKDPLSIYRQFVLGCFPMWKKNLHDKVGYFDEQFKITGDLEFQLRAAYAGAKFAKAPFLLGTFSWNDQNLSSGSILQDEESALVAFRYKLYHVLDLASLWYGKKIDPANITNFGKKRNLLEIIPNQRYSCLELGVSKYIMIWKFPYYLIRFFKKKIQKIANGF